MSKTDDLDENKILVEEINSLLNQASLIQIEQIRAMLPQLAIEQLQEIKALFWRMTSQRLRQYVESGELEAEIRLVSSNALIRSGNLWGPLALVLSSSPNLKSLPG
ncbi:hypothetical protein [aff. Roholtiella sp. LEGE 12411]|uniref:hypothetical protein n=1 Tax=aff. Roholtiella sp. LEGE 12411 TaxID=1828822 RepID=UPI0018809EAA|nr:hypothetical protein [aff. Roholtiella sp. LEGE 12411]MBE9035185.1 hypothetical protein [aff. Roholtiella sp. LEGE 12411]